MIRAWLAAAGLGGFLSVAAGAAAAHLPAGSRAADLLHTGAIYGMVHAAALVGIAAIAERRERPSIALRIAGWAFAVGLLLFSLSIDALAATGLAAIGSATPVGGVALLTGWAALGLEAAQRR
jgi:uncharacterized membrane protein YgdD (TMEM256/DUF423 family)